MDSQRSQRGQIYFSLKKIENKSVPFSERALKPGTQREDYYVYEAQKPLTVKAGEVLPWFSESGGGIQYCLDSIDGVRRSPATLTQGDDPFLKEVYRGKHSDYKPE